MAHTGAPPRTACPDYILVRLLSDVLRGHTHIGDIANSIAQLPYLNLALCISLQMLLAALSLVERVSDAAHERLCQFLCLPACEVRGPGNSAVVVVGGDDALGRHVALSFSQLGYTVFALCPDKPQAQVPSDADASNVSSLIQEWHQRIKRSGHSPWGLVAPIVLDVNSDAQRARAVETVDAYCAAHNLHLVALLLVPWRGCTSSKALQSGRAGMDLNVSAWYEALRSHLVEPISIVQDYVGALAVASGRVIVLFSSGHQPWLPSLQRLHKDTLLSAAHFLSQELDPLGIKVSTVSIGPSAPVNASQITHVETSRGHSSARRAARNLGTAGHLWGIPKTIEGVLNYFTVDHEEVWQTVQSIIRSP
ncbi:hypothetical protein GSI_13914 [Ganoderma sinense ZZ0214-1]|uniref:Ketoreductase (KR) domain-containing protein n=1 Tax=Ganoderma sinense ZZ0214-1 TaxID=1077348 RepID=A0A2G8RRP6_9APHY|nr:hypothetical protein GSI_13914 [Ganoderma sinense ZZ0214-1]